MSGCFSIIPAIDLRNGRVVRLYQGDYSKETQYAVDPIALAHNYATAGAEWLHVVDLEGARSGRLGHIGVLRQLTRVGLRIQAGGGVRARDDIKRLHNAGVERVVIGSMAVCEPERVITWLDAFGADRVTIALDTRWRDGAWRLPSAGWRDARDTTLDELAPRYAAAGARNLLCTAIDRDGTLAGPNLSLLAHLREIAPSLAVQVSGGGCKIEDVRAAREAGAAGMVLGRALLDGRLDLAEALAC